MEIWICIAIGIVAIIISGWASYRRGFEKGRIAEREYAERRKTIIDKLHGITG